MANPYETLSSNDLIARYLATQSGMPDPELEAEMRRRSAMGTLPMSMTPSANISLPPPPPAGARLGINVASQAGEPKPPAPSEADIVLNRVQQAGQPGAGALTPEMLRDIPQTIRLKTSSGSKQTTVAPGLYSEQAGQAMAKSFNEQAALERSKIAAEQAALGQEATTKPKYAAPTLSPEAQAEAQKTAKAIDWIGDLFGISGAAQKVAGAAEPIRQATITQPAERDIIANMSADELKRIADPSVSFDEKQSLRDASRDRLIATTKEEVPGTGKIGSANRYLAAIAKFRQESETVRQEAGWERDKRKRELQVAEQGLKETEDKLRNAEIDPNRMFRGVGGAVRGLLGTIGMMFGAYAQGISGGRVPNTAASLIEKAIDRDVDAQKTNLQKLMTERGWAKERQGFVMERFDMAKSEWKAEGLRLSALEVARHAAETEKADAILQTSKTIADLNARALGLERSGILALEQAKPKITIQKTGTGGSHEILNPQWEAAAKQIVAPEKGKQEKLPMEPGKDLREKLDYIQSANQLVDKFKMADPSRFEAIRRTKAASDEWNRNLLLLIQKYRHEASGAAFTESEQKQYMDMFSAGTLTGWGPALNFINKLKNDKIGGSLRILSQYPDYRRSVLPKDWDALRGVVPAERQKPQYEGEPVSEGHTVIPRPEYQGK